MTEAEAKAEAKRTGGTAYYDKYIGWYVLPKETREALERAKKPVAPAVTPAELEAIGGGVFPSALPPMPTTPTPPAVTPTPTTPAPTGEWDVDEWAMPSLPTTPTTTKGAIPPPPPRDQWPEGFIPIWDKTMGEYYWEYSPEATEEDKISAYNQAYLDYLYASLEAGEPQWRPGELELQQAQLAAQQQYQQWQQEEARRKYGAQLAAQPRSWLEYAAYTGEPATIQPWMQPLMPQQYQQLGAGEQIPGWTAESMAGMPELTRPSRQYQARMGPTAMAQYQGYRQARTGARPEETQWRQWSAAPPGGQYRGLTYAR